MKTVYRLQGKKVTKKSLIEMFGAERIKRITKEAMETFKEDPYIANDFFMGSKGLLNVEFIF